jgi:hypothetical protein
VEDTLPWTTPGAGGTRWRRSKAVLRIVLLGTAGTANTGGGGGGAFRRTNAPQGSGAAGGSGIVIVKELNKAAGVWEFKKCNLVP